MSPYRRFPKENLILRDHLAIDRTTLANERTGLAYLRTAMAFLVSGAGLMKFYSGRAALVGGWLFIAAAAFTAGFGFLRYRRMKKIITSALPK